MSTSEASIPDPSTGGGASADPVGKTSARSARLNQPWRAALAAVEIVVAAFLVIGAFWAWDKATVAIELPGLPDVTGVVSRLLGNWVAISVLAATLAGSLMLDAIRQVVLALRVRRRGASAPPAGASPSGEV